MIACGVIRSLPYLAPIRAENLLQHQQAGEFVDRNGLPLGTLLTRDQEHTSVVPLPQVSPHFIHAILAAEDADFYHHGALDLKAILRAIRDGMQEKRITSGASTITMQLARMTHPVPRSLKGKLQEVWLSWRIFAGMNHNQILSAYINRLPMGGNIYGLEAASRIYFGIPAADLNLAQASILAGLPNNPTYFNPYDHWQRLKGRQKYVLSRMVQEGYITKQQSDRAYAEPLSLQPRQQGILAAPHFLFWLSQQLPETTPSQIRTTLHRPLQQFVETQVQQVLQNLKSQNVHHAAALVVDNHTGEVLAYVGSPNYFDEANLGRNDGVQALRQPGSTLKPFLYHQALESRVIRPNTILADIPTHYAIPGAKLYSPTDYSETFLGPVRVRSALANSLNIPAVRVLEKMGVQNFLNRLQELGFSHLTQKADHYGLGLALGSGEVSLWELARAYVTLARQGEQIPLVATLSEQSVKAKTLGHSIASWQLITDMLSDNHARASSFGVDSILNLPFPAAVKTGTSSNFRDTWTVGYTQDYTVATWVGNFDGDRMNRVSGVTGAAPLWNRIMLHLHAQQEPESFPNPKNLVQRPICATSGLKPSNACPVVVQEYIDRQDLAQYEREIDKTYQLAADGTPRLNLPPEYNEWLSSQPSPAFTPGDLKILSPRNGDVFLMADGGKGRLQLQASQTGVEWWMNGQKLSGNQQSLFWPLQPGNWTLQVKDGEKTDTVTFQVQISQRREIKRGFSIGG